MKPKQTNFKRNALFKIGKMAYNLKSIPLVFSYFFLISAFMFSCNMAGSSESETSSEKTEIKDHKHYPTHYNTVEVDGVEIFYREAGPADAPTILLLHGYPTSSHMFRNLIVDLSDSYHLLAPDYPGYGRSEQPPMSEFDYTFDHMALLMEGFLEKKGVEKYSIYLMDYGAPIGYRIASKYPERVQSLIIQNGCAYEEGLEAFWDPIKAYWKDRTIENGQALEGFHSPAGLKWQYTHGIPDSTLISPDNWEVDLRHLSRPENDKIQLAMFYDYGTNPPLYPSWQKYFRDYQPPALVVYGKNDFIFPESGAQAYKKDLNNLEFHPSSAACTFALAVS